MSENQCTVKFSIDAWSTFYEDWTQKPCLVEREHVNDDTIGLHTLDEGIPVNRYITTNVDADSYSSTNGWIVIECNYDPCTKKDFQSISIVNNNIYGNQLFLVRNDADSGNTPGWHNLLLFIMACNLAGKTGAINNIYQVPYRCVLSTYLTADNFDVGDTGMGGAILKYRVATTNSVNYIKTLLDLDTSPVKNNKCKVYPYRYLYVTNNCGNANIYKWEQFEHTSDFLVKFEIENTLCMGGSVRAVPINYQGFASKYDEAIPLGKFPVCGWTSDAYTLWQTQQAVNQPVNFVSNMFGAGTQAQNSAYSYKQAQAQGNSYNTTGDILNIAGNFVSAVGNLVATEYSAHLLPNTLSGSNVGDVAFSRKMLRFNYCSMRICDEELKVIDDLFTRYGYKINETKMANITGRPYWNYIKIGDGECIGYGTVPPDYMEDINNICRSGVTIWHNHDNIGNFTLDNSLN